MNLPVKQNNNPTLYQRSMDKIALWELLLETGGEVNETLEAWLMEIDHSLTTKVDSYVFIQGELESEARRLRDQAREISDAAKSIENISERLNSRIKEVMSSLSTSEINGATYRYVLSDGKPKLIIDGLAEKNVRLLMADNLPNEYKMQVTYWVVDKEKIEADLLDMKSVPGCRFEKSNSLRKYVNKGDKKK